MPISNGDHPQERGYSSPEIDSMQPISLSALINRGGGGGNQPIRIGVVKGCVPCNSWGDLHNKLCIINFLYGQKEHHLSGAYSIATASVLSSILFFVYSVCYSYELEIQDLSILACTNILVM